MPGKPLDPANLQKDANYVLQGISVHGALESVCPPRPGLEVLEAGCGSGKLGLWYALRGCLVTLIDIDPGVLEYTRALVQIIAVRVAPVHFIGPHKIEQGSIRDLPYPTGAFDFVFNEGVPQHWSNDAHRQIAINEMVRVTRSGGWVCVVGSNAHCKAMMDYAAVIDHTYMDMPPKQVPWTRDEINGRLILAGLTGTNCLPLDGPWTESLLLYAWGTKT